MDSHVECQVSQELVGSIDEIICERIARSTLATPASLLLPTTERPFYVANLQDIYAKHVQWAELLPRVKPFYAVKCNNLPQIMSFLSLLGANFDCASKTEIDQVLALGVEPSRIIYANPCKTRTFIKHAQLNNVDLMTFDNELELHKVAELHPRARLVLRIKGDDRSSRCKFNIKFGADLARCRHLLRTARELRLNVVGVSFHNGSDCNDVLAYQRTIANCKQVFEWAQQFGFDMRILDIGGGFPGHKDLDGTGVSFDELASVINAALDLHFPEADPQTGKPTNYEIIAEPGRYYVASALTFVGMVMAKRVERDDETGNDCFMYYLNDGVYGAFNNIMFEQATPTPELVPAMSQARVEARALSKEMIEGVGGGDGVGVGAGCGAAIREAERKLRNTVLWGPTCDSVDCIKRDFSFPELEVGEWLLFKNMGAYTMTAASTFNGFERASVIVAA